MLCNIKIGIRNMHHYEKMNENFILLLYRDVKPNCIGVKILLKCVVVGQGSDVSVLTSLLIKEDYFFFIETLYICHD